MLVSLEAKGMMLRDARGIWKEGGDVDAMAIAIVEIPRYPMC